MIENGSILLLCEAGVGKRLLRRFPGQPPFDLRRQQAGPGYLESSLAAQAPPAGNYIGLP